MKDKGDSVSSIRKTGRSILGVLAFCVVSIIFDVFVFYTMLSALFHLPIIFILNPGVVSLAVTLMVSLLGHCIGVFKLKMPSGLLLYYIPEPWLVVLLKKMTGIDLSQSQGKNNAFLIWLIAYSGSMHLSKESFQRLKGAYFNAVQQSVMEGLHFDGVKAILKMPKSYVSIINKHPSFFKDLQQVERFQALSPAHKHLFGISCDLPTVSQAKVDQMLKIMQPLKKMNDTINQHLLSDQLIKNSPDFKNKKHEIIELINEMHCYLVRYKSVRIANEEPDPIKKIQKIHQYLFKIQNDDIINRINRIDKNFKKFMSSIFTAYDQIYTDINQTKEETLTSKQLLVLMSLIEMADQKRCDDFISQLNHFPVSDGILFAETEKMMPILGEKHCVVYASEYFLDVLNGLEDEKKQAVKELSDAQKEMLICHFDYCKNFQGSSKKECFDESLDWVKENEQSAPAYARINQLKVTDQTFIHQIISRRTIESEKQSVFFHSFVQVMRYISRFAKSITDQDIMNLFKMPFRKRHLCVSSMVEPIEISKIYSKSFCPKYDPLQWNCLQDASEYIAEEDTFKKIQQQKDQQFKKLTDTNGKFPQTGHFTNGGIHGGSNVWGLFEAQYKKARFEKYAHFEGSSERVWADICRTLKKYDFDVNVNDVEKQLELRLKAAKRLVIVFKKNDNDVELGTLPSTPDLWSDDKFGTHKRVRNAIIFMCNISDHIDEVLGNDSGVTSDACKESYLKSLSEYWEDCPNQFMNQIWAYGNAVFFQVPQLASTTDEKVIPVRDIKEALQANPENNFKSALLSEAGYKIVIEKMIKCLEEAQRELELTPEYCDQFARAVEVAVSGIVDALQEAEKTENPSETNNSSVGKEQRTHANGKI